MSAPDPVARDGGEPMVDCGRAQFLTFTLGTEQYGVDILRVREIRGFSPVTRIPRSPAFVLGVLNLRGAIVPVLDMRLRFALERAEYTPTTVTIVLSVAAGDGERQVGVVVDAVSDVLEVPAADIQPPPDFGAGVDAEFISGLASLESNMVMLLDVDRLLDAGEMSQLNEARLRAPSPDSEETQNETP
jgi:purine-binding chemotaxis protein CheW